MTRPPFETISHYRLLEPLGQGAMGEVWLAEDTQLPRKVAVKLISQKGQADGKPSEENLQRLMREAQATASIDHPAVVVMHETGEVDGVPFLVMQHLTGETLAARLQQGPLTMPDTVELAVRVADALSEVHAMGIVHRDLKPSNIMLTPRGAKILDFGVASVKALPTLTETDALVGTPATMSPEQVRGMQADNRSDLWALGVILYQSLSGKLPFTGTTYETFLHQVLNVDPPPLRSLQPEVSPDLEYIVMKLLRKNPQHRYSRAEDVLADLANFQRMQSDPQLQATSFGPSGRDPHQVDTPPGVAVLPFEVMSNEEDDSFLAAGLAEDLLVDLTRVGDLRVASRAEVSRYTDRTVPPRTIARELNVDYLVTGTVRRLGQRARISAQLVRGDDGYGVWADRFDRQLEDLFDVQAEISEQIVGALQVALKPGESEMLQRPPTSNTDAYRLYLQGREQMGRGRDENLLAERLLKQAIELDPQFALAHAALGEVYGRRGLNWWAGKETADLAAACAQRSLAIEPNNIDALRVQIMVARLRGDPEEVLTSIDRVMALNSQDRDVREWSAWSYLSMGQPEKVLPILANAETALLRYVDSAYAMLGRHDEARRVRERYAEWLVEQVRRDASDVHARSLLGTVLVNLGRTEEGMEQGQRAVDLSPRDGRILYNAACSHAIAGEPAKALDILKRAISDLPEYIADWPRYDPDLVSLHDDPEFVRLFGRADTP